MIKNERQYRVTKTQAERFERTLAELRRDDREEGDVHPLIAKASKEAVASQLADLKAELREYESLKTGKFEMDGLQVVSDLPTTPEGVTTEESDTRVIEQWSQIHLRIGIEAMTEIDERGEKMKHFTY